MNADGDAVWVKYHLKTDQGIECLTNAEAAVVAGENPESNTTDLMNAIDEGNFPSWTVNVQIMPFEDAATYSINPFDVTKVWPHADYPLIEIGKMVLNRNPVNYFADVEQAGFDPANFVPGIGPSPDKMLQGRLFAYGDAHRYRLGINHTQLPVNRPHATDVDNYGRDGSMRFDDNGGDSKNYEPNSFDGPAQSNEPIYKGIEVSGATGTYEWDERDTDNFSQAGDLYRLMDDAAQQRLIDSIAGDLSGVSKDEIIEKSLANFANADPEYGSRLRSAIDALRS